MLSNFTSFQLNAGVHDPSGNRARTAGYILHVNMQLNRTICTRCGLCYLLYQHYVISPSMTYVSLWIYGVNSSLFLTSPPRARGVIEPGRALDWISVTQTGFHRAQSRRTLEGETGCKSLNPGQLKVSGVHFMSGQRDTMHVWFCDNVIERCFQLYLQHLLLFLLFLFSCILVSSSYTSVPTHIAQSFNNPQRKYVFDLGLAYNYQLPSQFLDCAFSANFMMKHNSLLLV